MTMKKSHVSQYLSYVHEHTNNDDDDDDEEEGDNNNATEKLQRLESGATKEEKKNDLRIRKNLKFIK
jgi:hypothetical protein